MCWGQEGKHERVEKKGVEKRERVSVPVYVRLLSTRLLVSFLKLVNGDTEGEKLRKRCTDPSMSLI